MGARVSIGDFAVMTSLSRKALRHYHDIGILEPAHIDSHTGYRFYDTSQVDHAHIIRRFRSLGMSIPDIKALLSTDDAAARAIAANIATLGVEDHARVLRADACRLEAPPHPFDLAFLDPPYGQGMAAKALTALTERGWCVSGGLAVVETGLEDTFELDLERFDERVYGDTRVYFLRIT